MAKLESNYYGRRKVVYVHITEPSHKGEPQKHLSVYGVTVKEVIKVVGNALEKAFGRTATGRPPGRPRKKRWR